MDRSSASNMRVAFVALCLAVGAVNVACTPTGATPSRPAPTAVPAAVEPSSDAPPAVVDVVEPNTEASPDRTVDPAAFRMATLTSASCVADAPADWSMHAPDRSDSADLLSPDGSLYAGYGIKAVNTALAPFAAEYDPPLNDPDLYSADPGNVAVGYGRGVVAAIGGSLDLAGEELYQATPNYLVVTTVSSTHRGAIFFHRTGFPGDGINYAYALPMYFAFTTIDRWETEGLLVARVAASIRCSTQFQPPDDYPIVEASPAGEAVDENGDDAGYNPHLGTEYVNDPTTGENYLVDPSTNWSATGPDGPGYYVPKAGGNGYQKLEPGRID